MMILQKHLSGEVKDMDMSLFFKLKIVQ